MKILSLKAMRRMHIGLLCFNALGIVSSILLSNYWLVGTNAACGLLNIILYLKNVRLQKQQDVLDKITHPVLRHDVTRAQVDSFLRNAGETPETLWECLIDSCLKTAPDNTMH